jgi:hypothetical protein
VATYLVEVLPEFDVDIRNCPIQDSEFNNNFVCTAKVDIAATVVKSHGRRTRATN